MTQDIVLIPGLWMGAWAWEPVARHLEDLGHNVHAITLSGLSADEDGATDTGPAAHVDDVLALLEAHDLRDVTIAAHGYGGFVAGQVAGRVPDRVAHTVFVEAFLPQDGVSVLHAFPEPVRRDELEFIAANGGRWPAPAAAEIAEGQDLSLRQAQAIRERMVGHPGRTLSEPAVMPCPLEELRGTYVICAQDHFGGSIPEQTAALRSAPAWQFRTIDTGHWPMFSAPRLLAELIAEEALRSKAPLDTGRAR